MTRFQRKIIRLNNLLAKWNAALAQGKTDRSDRIWAKYMRELLR